MNRLEAKEVLLLYRPGTADAEDPEVREAMDLAGRDEELGHWFAEHQAFQKAMRAKFRQIEAPAHLKAALLAQDKVIALPTARVAWWQKPAWLAAAAAVVLFVAWSFFSAKPMLPNQFVNFRDSMVSKALREYAMDWTTGDMAQLRQRIAGRGAPGDYAVTPGLAKLRLSGGAALRWRSNPVAMVCFDRGDKQMLFLFVMPRAALSDPPPPKPALNKVSQLQTASWTEGDKIYVLAGPADEPAGEFVRKYF